MHATLAVFVALSIALAGCGGDQASAEDEEITFSRSGGIAGVSESLRIETDGSATLVREFVEPAEELFQVSEADLTALREAFRDADFESLESPDDAEPCADCFEYSVSVGDHTVEANSSNVPEPLSPLIGELEQLVARQTP